MIAQGISVIVPTKGRTEYVKETLLSLAAAREHCSKSAQIIVVDDSSENEARQIKAICETSGAEYFYYRRGISHKRNFGISQARFPVVLFIDSDCKVDTDIFSEHLKYYSDDNIGGCLGLTEFTGKKTMVSEAVTEKIPIMPPHQFAKHVEYAPWGPCTNISFRRDVLEQVQGFASFLPPKEGSEDVDIGYRVRQLGCKIKCNPNAVVSHPREALGGWNSLIERAFRWGRAETYLLARYSKSSYLDAPKSAIVFGILLVTGACVGVLGQTFSLALLSLLWYVTAIVFQCFVAFHSELRRTSWQEAICSSLSVIVDSVFEIGTIAECFYRRRLRLLPFKFIYEEGQLSSRWHRGMIRIWSFVIAFVIIFVVYIILL